MNEKMYEKFRQDVVMVYLGEAKVGALKPNHVEPTTLSQTDSTLTLSHGAAIGFNDTLLTFGGYVRKPDQCVISDRIFYLPLCTDTMGWTEVMTTGPKPTARHSHVTVLGPRGAMYVHGGVSAEGIVLSDMTCLFLGDKERSWSEPPYGHCTTPPLYDHAAVFDKVRRLFYLHGGRGPGGFFSDVLYEIRLDGTMVSHKSPVALRGHRMSWTKSGECLILYGGREAGSEMTNLTCYLYYPHTMTWTAHPPRVTSPLPPPSDVNGYPVIFDRKTQALYTCGASSCWKGVIPMSSSSAGDLPLPWEKMPSIECFKVRNPSTALSPPAHDGSLFLDAAEGGCWLIGGTSRVRPEENMGGHLYHFDIHAGMWTARSVQPHVNVLETIVPHPPKAAPRIRNHLPRRPHPPESVPPLLSSLPLLPTIPTTTARRPKGTHSPGPPLHSTQRPPPPATSHERLLARILADGAFRAHGGHKGSPSYDSLQKAVARQDRVLNFSKKSVGRLRSEDIVVASWILLHCPHVSCYDFTSQHLDDALCDVILQTFDENCGLTDVILTGVTLVNVDRDFQGQLLERVMRNKELSEKHTAALAAKKDERKREKAAARRVMKDLIEQKLTQQRWATESAALVRILSLQQQCSRGCIDLERQVAVGKLHIQAAEREKYLQRRLALLSTQLRERNFVFAAEESARQTHVALYDCMVMSYSKDISDAYRKVGEAIRERSRAQKRERDAAEHDEKLARTRVRCEEEAAFVNCFTDWQRTKEHYRNMERRKLKKLADEEEERCRKIAEEKARIAELKRLKEAWEARQRADVANFIEITEPQARDSSLAREEALERNYLLEQLKESLVMLRVIERRKARVCSRDKVRHDIPNVTITNYIPERAFVSQSTTPIRIFPTDHVATLSFSASVPKYLQKHLPQDPGEITSEQWVIEKTTLVGGSVCVSVHDPSPEDAIFLVNESTGEKENEGSASCIFQLPANEDCSVLALKESLRRVWYVRSGTSVPENPVVVSIDVTLHFKVPQECPPKDQVATFVMSTAGITVTLRILPPVLWLPQDSTAISYVEGSGFVSAFKRVQVMPPTYKTFPQPQLTLSLLTKDKKDRIGLETIKPTKKNPTSLLLQPNRSAESGVKIVAEQGLVLATCTQQGRLCQHDDPSEFTNSLPPVPDTTLTLLNGLNDVQRIVSRLGFRNDDENPIEGDRVLRITVSLTEDLSVSTQVVVSLQGVDNPTIVDMGFACICYRTLAPLPEMQEYIQLPPPLYIGGAATVTDSDTSEFEGGEMIVAIVNGGMTGDSLQLSTLNDVVHLNGNEISVMDNFRMVFIGKLKADVPPTQVHILFDSCSISLTQILLQSIVFQSSNPNPKFGSRVVSISLKVGEAEAVRTTITVQVTAPMLTLARGNFCTQFPEGSEYVKIAPIDTKIEDEDWASGFLMIECLEGWTDNDRLKITEDKEIQVKLRSETEPQPLSSGPAIARKGLKVETLSDTAPSTPLRPQSGRPQSPPRSSTVLKDIMREKLKLKVDQLAEARVVAMDKLRANILQVVRTPANSKKVEKFDLTILGELCGEMSVNGALGAISISFTRPIKASQIRILLKNLKYKNVSKNETVLHKLFRVTATNKQPHVVPLYFRIEIEAKDDATEFRKPTLGNRQYRQHDASDINGFTFLDDIECFDPDTEFFNEGVLSIELIAGADPKGDQLSLLPPILQRLRGGDDLIEVTDSTLCYRDMPYATYAIDQQPSKPGNSNVRINFLAEPAIDISLLQRTVHLVCYTNVASKAKEGTLTFQLHFNLHGTVSKKRFFVDVKGPLLWTPSDCDAKYKEGQPPVSIGSKVVVNLSEKKDFIKDGAMKVHVYCGRHEDDRLAIDFSKSDWCVKDSTDLYAGKEYIGKLSIPNGVFVLLKFDWASKANEKILQDLFRKITFCNVGNTPGPKQRGIEMSLFTKNNESPSIVRFWINVACKDAATRVMVPFPRFTCVRRAAPTELFKDAVVEDAETDIFTAPSYLDVDVKNTAGQTPGSDHVYFLDGAHGLYLLKSGHVVDNTDVDETEMDAVQEAAIAVLSTGPPEGFPRLPTKARFTLLQCTTPQLQSIVRSITYATRVRDPKVAEKQAVLQIKNTTAQLTKISVSMEFMSPLLEVVFGKIEKETGGPLLTSCKTGAGHFAHGATVVIRGVGLGWVAKSERVGITDLLYVPGEITFTAATAQSLVAMLLDVQYGGPGGSPATRGVELEVWDTGRGLVQREKAGASDDDIIIMTRRPSRSSSGAMGSLQTLEGSSGVEEGDRKSDRSEIAAIRIQCRVRVFLSRRRVCKLRHRVNAALRLAEGGGSRIVHASYGGSDVTAVVQGLGPRLMWGPGQYHAVLGGRGEEDPLETQSKKVFVVITLDPNSDPPRMHVSTFREDESLDLVMGGAASPPPGRQKETNNTQQGIRCAFTSIVAANYGGLDVTARVHELVAASGCRELKIQSPHEVFGDPLVGTVKVFAVTYLTPKGEDPATPSMEVAYWFDGQAIELVGHL